MTRVTLLLLSSAAVLAAPAIAIAASSNAPTAGSNRVYLNQADDGNVATIAQSGTGNQAGSDTSSLRQNAGRGGAGANRLDIEQTGNNGIVGNTVRYDGVVDTMQRGSGNVLTVRQDGSGNAFYVSQFGSHSNMTPAGASIPLDPALVPTTGWNTIEQGNTGNTATVRQGRNDDTANGPVTNSGNERNAGFIIRQTGAGNGLYIGQTNGSNSLTYAEQSGDRNSINFAQSYHGSGNFATDFNFADLRQTGSDNQMTPDQNGNNDRLTVLQSGNANRLVSRQNATSSTFTITQSGSDSSVWAAQGSRLGFPRGNLDIFVNPPQIGTNFNGFVQLDPSQTTASSLIIDQSTTGRAVAAFFQNGTGEIARLTQRGSGNYMIGQQEGASNTAYMTQSGGSGNQMFLDQTGTGMATNRATLTQDGGMNNFTFVQQTGYGQQATIVQGFATGNVSNTLQSGSNNSVTVRQNRS